MSTTADNTNTELTRGTQRLDVLSDDGDTLGDISIHWESSSGGSGSPFKFQGYSVGGEPDQPTVPVAVSCNGQCCSSLPPHERSGWVFTHDGESSDVTGSRTHEGTGCNNDIVT
nr:uncharacterized protein I203_03474 [Kwoniella mangroviensis CBS 8507]OCF67776.1 hypothetical protein I203_03474 [Kwoniella mangroviensis CBS 8507]